MDFFPVSQIIILIIEIVIQVNRMEIQYHPKTKPLWKQRQEVNKSLPRDRRGISGGDDSYSNMREDTWLYRFTIIM